MNKLERINKYLSDAGVCSRREVDELITAGRVEVNGVLARIGMQIDTTKDHVTVDGQWVDPANPQRNAINEEALEVKRQPWWEERNERRESIEEARKQNPKSKLLRKGKKRGVKQVSLKTAKPKTKLSGKELEAKAAKRAENKKAKSFSEALSDKQKLMNVKTRRIDHAVNPKAANLRGKKHAVRRRR